MVYGAVGAAGFVLGTVAGGLLAALSWRWVFYGPAVLGLLLFAASVALIRPDTPREPGSGGFDLLGALTATGGMVAVVYALIALGDDPDLSDAVLPAVLAGGLLAAFVVTERRTASPLLRLGIVREGLLPYASIAGLLFMGAFFGFQFTLTLFLQELLGWSAVETGLTFAIMGLDLILAPQVTPVLVRRFGNAPVMTAGLVAGALAFGRLIGVQEDWDYLDLLPSLVLVGVAFALVYGPLTSAATEGVSEDEQGAAGGVLYTAFQFGGALGLAGVTIALAAGDGPVPGADDYGRALVVPTVAATITVVVGVLASVRRRSVAR